MRGMGRIFAFVAAVAVLAAGGSSAQLEKPVEKPIVGPRRPSLSPDGSQIAFVYRGDIWTAPSAGGRAYRLTDHVELDNVPLFSPDGEWIAFTSARNGNNDIFVVPAAGGAPTQLTYSGAGEVAWDWSPDGKSLLFSGQRDVPDPTLFSLDVKTLRFRALLSDYKGAGYCCYSPDGGTVAYDRDGFPYVRPRYTGSSAAEIWTMELASGKRKQITRDERQHLWPHFTPDGQSILCAATGETTPATCKLGETLPKIVDNERRTPNLWSFGLDGKGKQLTHFVGGAVRWPTVAHRSGDMAFEYGDGIWILKAGAKDPVKLTLFAPSDDKENNLRRETLTGGVEEAEVSPDGKTIAFRIQGEVWSIPVEKPKKKRNADDATRLTTYAGWDGDFVWSKDSKKLFFVSDRDNSLGLYEVDAQTQATRPVWQGDGDAYRPRLTPDGKLLAFWVAGDKGGLYTMPVAGGEATRLVDVPGNGAWGPGGRDFSFSPDMQWVAYTRRLNQGNYNLWIMPMKGGEAVNVTRLNAYHGDPVWSPDGKYLFLRSDRDGDGLYVIPLKREDARADELEMKFSMPKKDAPKPAPQAEAKPAPEGEAKPTEAPPKPEAAPAEPVKVEIDFQDIETRIRKHSAQNPDDDLTIGPDGTLYCISGGDACSVSFDGKEVKRLTSGGGFVNLRLMPDGKKLLLVKGGVLQILTLGNNNPVAPHTFSALWERDVRAERHAAFIEFWRTFNRSFYDPNFHGRDWSALRDRYEPLLDSVGTRDEFAGVLSMMVGELESSHSEVGPAPGPSGPSTPNLGFYFDYDWEGPGIRVKEVPERAPGSYEKTKLNPGEYVMAVNGQDVRLDENLFRTLNDFDGKDLDLLVNAKPAREGARTVTYKALSWGDWRDIHYRNRIQRLREQVEKASGGKIAYLHIAGMGASNQAQFEREFYEYTIGKDAVIVDVRFNGGGNIADTLTSWLALKPYGFNRPRGAQAEPVPARSWEKPMVVLMNESSMSNAEMYPYDMKATGLATLIGMPTPGYVIWTRDFRLVDGTRARLPGSGVWRKDGTPLENCGQQPDIKVDLSAEEWLAQKDPQLDAAIAYLMKKK